MSLGFTRRVRWLVAGKTGTAAAVQTTLSQVLVLVANFATGLVSARALGVFGRGEVAAITLIPQLIGFMTAAGIPGALIYHFRRTPERAARLIGTALVLNAIFGLIAIGIAELVIPAALHRYDASIVVLARWFALAGAANLVYYTCAAVLEASGDFWSANMARLLVPVLTLASLVTFVLLHRLDVLTATIAYLVPAGLVQLMVLSMVLRRTRPRIGIDSDGAKWLLGYGLRSYGLELLRAIGGQIDQVLVIGFLSPASMGVYVVALSMASTLQVVTGAVSRVLFPRMSAQPIDEIVARVGDTVRITVAVATVGAVLLIALGPLLLHVFYGERFAGAAGPLRVLAVDAVVSGATGLLAQAFMAGGRPGILTVFQAAALALSIPLMVVLIPRVGLIGAPVAILLSSIVRLGLVVAAFPLILRVAPPSLLITVRDVALLRRRLRTHERDAA